MSSSVTTLPSRLAGRVAVRRGTATESVGSRYSPPGMARLLRAPRGPHASTSEASMIREEVGPPHAKLPRGQPYGDQAEGQPAENQGDDRERNAHAAVFQEANLDAGLASPLDHDEVGHRAHDGEIAGQRGRHRQQEPSPRGLTEARDDRLEEENGGD